MKRLHPFHSLLAALAVIATTGSPRAELLVSSFDSNRVFRYDEANGAFIDIFVPNTDGRLSLPHGLAFGPDGNLYVASAGNDSVLRYLGTSGAFLDTFVTSGAGGLDYPVSLIFRPDGMLYVTSQLNDRVLRFNDTTGAFVDVFITNTAALDGPSDMVFGPGGHLYVTGRFNNRVVRYDGATGALIDPFVTSNLSQPFGLCFAGTNLLVASGNQNSLRRFDALSGELIDTFSPVAGLSLPIGVVVGPDENVYVASYGNHKVTRFDTTTGAHLGDLVASGSGGLTGPNFMIFRPAAPAPPRLEIALTTDAVELSWRTNGIPFRLEENVSGWGTPQWTDVSGNAAVVGTSNVVTEPVQPGSRFFRLISP